MNSGIYKRTWLVRWCGCNHDRRIDRSQNFLSGNVDGLDLDKVSGQLKDVRKYFSDAFLVKIDGQAVQAVKN